MSALGQTVRVEIYGRMETCTIVKVHPFNTFDVRTSDGRYYRVSGVDLQEVK